MFFWNLANLIGSPIVLHSLIYFFYIRTSNNFGAEAERSSFFFDNLRLIRKRIKVHCSSNVVYQVAV